MKSKALNFEELPSLPAFFDHLTCNFLDGIYQERRTTAPYSDYEDKPVEFLREILGITLITSEQRHICESIRDNTITNVKAAASVGKSFIAAGIVIWWVFAVGGRCITTAPTETQVDEILWSEVRAMYDRKVELLGGKRGQLFLRFNEQARAVGLTADDSNANAFHGKHAHKLLMILDEACGISKVIDDAAMACITGAENRLLRIGNPISDDNPFASACAVKCISIAAWSHPNVSWAYQVGEDGIHQLKPEIAELILKPESDKDDSPVISQEHWPSHFPRDIIPGAISINWIEMIRKSKTERSAFWQSRIEAHFPEDAERSIIPRSWFKAARARYDQDKEFWDATAAAKHSRHGLDIGDGGDPHAHAKWQGAVLYSVKEIPTIGDRLDVQRAAEYGINRLRENPGSMAVDQIGVGAGALSGILTMMDNDYRDVGINSWAVGVNFGRRIRRLPKTDIEPGEVEALNVRAEEYWMIRRAFELGEVVVAPLGDYEEKLIEELAKTYYEETPDGKIKIEDKRKTRARLHRSPNLADAATMGYPNRPDIRTVEEDFVLTRSYPTGNRF